MPTTCRCPPTPAQSSGPSRRRLAKSRRRHTTYRRDCRPCRPNRTPMSSNPSIQTIGTSSGGRYAVSPIAPISLRRSAALAAPLAAMVIGAAPAARAQQPGEQGVVAGTVVAQGSLRPLPGAQVGTRVGRGAITDATGRFRITGLITTPVTLTARLIGYGPVTRTVALG